MSRHLSKLLIATLLLCHYPAVAQTTHTTLPAPVKQTLARHKAPAGGVSIFVQEVGASEPLLVYRPDRPRLTASAIKVLTTFIALDQLGPAYEWKTEAYLRGELRDGRLRGDLIIKGYGDPFFVTEYIWKFLHDLRARGLKYIDGDLVVDNTHFDIEAAPAHYSKPERAYNALPDALLANFQTIRFQFLPELASGRVRVVADPAPANLKIDNRLKLSNGRCAGQYRRLKMLLSNGADTTKVTFTGNYPRSCGEKALYRIVLGPQAQTFGLLRTLWEQGGGTINGGVRAGKAPATAPFYTFKSRPLADLIRAMNKFSNNVMTRQLLLTLGAEAYGPPGTEQKGRDAIFSWLRQRGLQFGELTLDNGAGLSRTTRVSARSLARFMSLAHESPLMPHLLASLPLSGNDGTLRRRFVNEELTGRIYLKTGTLNNVKTITGYLLSRSGKKFVVVCLQNYPGSHKGVGEAVQDALLRWVFEQ
ncbi:MAG: D-alanyl-D-alanine carboxypeptidase/D-alanyl-D-alanine endopeptidase [Gammaproteobacteria bacterium]